MKIGVSSYSFQSAINQGKINLFESISKAKEIGFDHIEFSEFPSSLHMTHAEIALRLREESERVGLPILCYTIAGNFVQDDIWPEIERLMAEMDVAKAMGCTLMRHDTLSWGGLYPGYKGSLDDLYPKLVEGCRQVADYAAGQGIATMVENHGLLMQDSSRVARLVTSVARPNYGALVDIGNFLCVDEDPQSAVGHLIPYALHVHAKDFHVRAGSDVHPGPGWLFTRGGNWLRGAIVGHGNVPVFACMQQLVRRGYQGALSIEFEGLEDSFLALELGLHNLRHYASMLEA